MNVQCNIYCHYFHNCSTVKIDIYVVDSAFDCCIVIRLLPEPVAPVVRTYCIFSAMTLAGSALRDQYSLARRVESSLGHCD